MARTKPSAFNAERDEVERRMSDAEPFESIEKMIDGADISEDEKAALWLLAWSGQPRRARNDVVVQALTAVQGRA